MKAASPAVLSLAQLLARFTHRNCDANALAEVVEKDALLSAQVLRLANSAALGRKRPIITVKHAIALIGVGAMRRFALGSSLSNIFSRHKVARGFSVMRFNLHSVATATLVELLADELPVSNPENAFVSGLLHDVGKILVAVSLPKEFVSVLEVAAVSHRPMIECEHEILGTDHAELSGLAITRWDLPAPVRLAGFYHHQPEALEEGAGDRKKLELTTVVSKANQFVNYLGMSVLPSSAQVMEPPSLEFAGFQYNQKRTLERFEQEWKGLSDLFR